MIGLNNGHSEDFKVDKNHLFVVSLVQYQTKCQYILCNKERRMFDAAGQLTQLSIFTPAVQNNDAFIFIPFFVASW